jgi:hypothetical protein
MGSPLESDDCRRKRPMGKAARALAAASLLGFPADLLAGDPMRLCLFAFALLAAGISPVQATPLTLDQAMAHPDWIGPPVESAWWALDGQRVHYTLKREGSPVRDTWTLPAANPCAPKAARWPTSTRPRSRTTANAGARCSSATAMSSCARPTAACCS